MPIPSPLPDRVVVALREAPGSSLRELAATLGVSPATLRSRLRELVESGVVHVVRLSNRHAYFMPEASGVRPAAFRVRPLLKELLREVEQAGEVRQAQLVSAMLARGWSQSTTRHRLLQLERAGLVTRRAASEPRNDLMVKLRR